MTAHAQTRRGFKVRTRLVVLSIAILLVAGYVVSVYRKVMLKRASVAMLQTREALAAYVVRTGEWPTSWEDLRVTSGDLEMVGVNWTVSIEQVRATCLQRSPQEWCSPPSLRPEWTSPRFVYFKHGPSRRRQEALWNWMLMCSLSGKGFMADERAAASSAVDAVEPLPR